jgi:hypothetical protein
MDMYNGSSRTVIGIIECYLSNFIIDSFWMGFELMCPRTAIRMLHDELGFNIMYVLKHTNMSRQPLGYIISQLIMVDYNISAVI